MKVEHQRPALAEDHEEVHFEQPGLEAPHQATLSHSSIESIVYFVFL